MSEITGVVTVRHEGRTYNLVLGMSGLGQLQKEYGQQLEPLMAMAEEGKMPDFSVLVRVMQIALQRFHPDADEFLVDDLLRADISIPVRVIGSAFPQDEAEAPGNVAKPRRKKAGRRG